MHRQAVDRVLIIGANSAIAEAVARLLAERGAELFLVARNAERLQSLRADLLLRGARSIELRCLELDDLSCHANLIEEVSTHWQQLDCALIAHGSCPPQVQLEQNPQAALALLHTNTLSTLSLLSQLAAQFERQRSGSIAVLSSAAADRGRQSNYIYAASKAAVNTYLQGMRHRLYPYDVQVLTIKAGLVDTPMTQAFAKGLLWASPERVAQDIVRALQQRRRLLYTPWFWRPIMWLVRALPEALLLRSRL